jgi:tetratricopeptide (TPR) repeat protein
MYDTGGVGPDPGLRTGAAGRAREQVLAGFTNRLRELRLAAGNPSYRTLADAHLPRSTMRDMLDGRTNPKLDAVLRFVRACGKHSAGGGLLVESDLLDEDQWRAAWLQVQRELGVQRRESGHASRPDGPAADGPASDSPADARPASDSPADARPASGSPASGGPADARPVVPRQLPRDTTPFVGRSAELRQLDGLLLSDDPGAGTAPAAVLVAGMAGAGKTALAVHWAHHRQDRFPDGVIYLDLGGYGGDRPVAPAQALEFVLRSAGVPALDGGWGLAALAPIYRDAIAGRRMLLVLDDAADENQVRPLLPGSPGCAVLVTSRRVLAGLVVRDGIHSLPVGPLSTDESAELLRRMIGARAVADPAAATRMAQRCGHLALALRLAAERARRRRQVPLAELAEELSEPRGHRLDALAPQDLDPDVDLRSVFSRSYDLLPTAEARLFRLLSLHTGAVISVPAAASLAGVPLRDAGRLLDRLVTAHLVEEVDTDRFRLHDLLRCYAAELAEAVDSRADRDAAVSRLLEWYLRRADAADRLIFPERPRRVPLDPPASDVTPYALDGVAEAVRWYDAECANLLAATRRAAEVGADEVAWQLPYASLSYFNLRKPWSQWVESYRIAIASAQRLGDHRALARLLNGLGIAYRELRRYDEATAVFQQAVGEVAQLADQDVLGMVFSNLGATAGDSGDHAAAAHYYQQAVAISADLGDRWGTSVALHNLAEAELEAHQYDRALDHCRQALGICRELGDRAGEGAELTTMGQIHAAAGRPGDAIRELRRALALRARAGDRQGQAIAAHRLGRLLTALDQRRSARHHLGQALAIFTELDDPQVADVRASLARLDGGPPAN